MNETTGSKYSTSSCVNTPTVLTFWLFITKLITALSFFPFAYISDALIEAIHADIREAEQALEKTENKEFASHSFFNKTESGT